MSYHVVDISSEGVILAVKHKQLVCRTKDGEEKHLPMEDVRSVVINSFSALLHNSFLTAAAECRIPVIICDKFKPKSVILPVQRGGDTLLTRAQITASYKLLDGAWRKTIKAKVWNQFNLLEEKIGSPQSDALDNFAATMNRDDPSMEGNCARIYWRELFHQLGVDNFKRLKDGDGINSLLNYGYGVLLSRVLQLLLAYGLDPLYGIGHAVRERAMPLAYDLMEPFRPLVDRMVYDWCDAIMKGGGLPEVSKEYKLTAHNLLKRECKYDGERISVENLIEQCVLSFRSALLDNRITEYKPWIWRNSKWAG